MLFFSYDVPNDVVRCCDVLIIRQNIKRKVTFSNYIQLGDGFQVISKNNAPSLKLRLECYKHTTLPFALILYFFFA